MNTKYLKTLEYDKILEALSKYCKTYIGKEKATNLLPVFEKSKVIDLLNMTKEAIDLINRNGNIPISNIPDISISLLSLESDGTLSILALLNIAKFLKISREVKEYFFLP